MSAPAVAPRRRTSVEPGTLRVALAGCGVVGGELVRLLRADAHAIARTHGVRVELARVLVRDPAKVRPVSLAPDVVTADVDDFLRTPADVVIEAIGGLDPARRIARTAVERGARFVTANKALVASEGERLQSRARARRGRLQFEAAVGGGVPVIRVLREAMGFARPLSVRGILNGTSNFVLTRMERGASYEAALEEARRRGLAEADPTRDLDGSDAADKIAILAWLAHGLAPHAVSVARWGLLPAPERLVRDAAAAGGRLRLVADCVALPEGVCATVAPTVVPAGSALGRTEHEQNRVVLDFGWAAPLELSGPGAGGAPTAAALLGDILRAGPVARPASAAPAAACDPREHRWLVSALGGASWLRDRFAAAGVPVDAVEGDGAVSRVRTLPVRDGRLRAAVADLAACAVEPLVARLDPGLGGEPGVDA